MSEPLVRLGLWLFRQIARLPDRWVRRVGFALGDLLWWLARGRRDIALTNLALCFPQRTEAQRRARILLDRVSRQLRRQGINCEQRTAGELALAARGKPNVRAEHVTEALRTYDEVRFGQRPLDRSRLKALCRQLRATRPAP